jgi:hypothetical protein
MITPLGSAAGQNCFVSRRLNTKSSSHYHNQLLEATRSQNTLVGLEGEKQSTRTAGICWNSNMIFPAVGTQFPFDRPEFGKCDSGRSGNEASR